MDTQDKSRKITGIHHVTAMAGDPQANVDFYTGTLGLRLVKRTINFDDPGTYHLYYGNEVGQPGTILTFFPWPGARRGRQGAGQATVTSFRVPEGSLGYWQERLENHGIAAEAPRVRAAFDEEVLTFLDPDGLQLELVARAGAGGLAPWETGPVPAEKAIRGFESVTLTEWNPEVTANVLTRVMGYQPIGEERDRFRFEAAGGGPAARIDVLAKPDAPRGHVSAGTVHHVAFRVDTDEQQQAWHQELLALGFHVSPILDRQYFHSIYFREPGGVLFEIATDPPGFTRDETVEQLGSGLKLPPWLEPSRQEIESVLPPLEVGRAPVLSGAGEIAGGAA
jgi:glyoxalase family protein